MVDVERPDIDGHGAGIPTVVSGVTKEKHASCTCLMVLVFTGSAGSWVLNVSFTFSFMRTYITWKIYLNPAYF